MRLGKFVPDILMIVGVACIVVSHRMMNERIGVLAKYVVKWF